MGKPNQSDVIAAALGGAPLPYFRMEDSGKCPRCERGTYLDFAMIELPLTREVLAAIGGPVNPTHVRSAVCMLCRTRIVELGSPSAQQPIHFFAQTAFPPRRAATFEAPEDVPADLRDDYHEAGAVKELSPRASAALSRRCLERLLKHHLGLNAKDLSALIDQAMKTLPPLLADSIDAIRTVGNFAAHPGKSAQTAEVLDVEAGEADWSLDVLASLFDFYFVQPAELKKKRDAMNEKLQSAGRAPMKSSTEKGGA